MNSPRSVDIAITNSCNLRCSYCYHFDSPAEQGEDLPTRDWLQFFEELQQLAVLEVCLSGGEFFARRDIKELLQNLTNKNIRYSILSNGTLITEEIASFIVSTKRCNHIQISLDGSTSEIHNSCRGDDCFEQVIRGMSIIRRQQIPLSVRVTIHKHNVRHLEDIAKFLLVDFNLPFFSTNAASSIGNCAKNASSIILDVEERMFAMKTLLLLNKKYLGRIKASAGPLAEAKKWHQMELAKAGKIQMQDGGYLSSCTGFVSKIAVRPDGTIIPCTQLPQIELGKINTNSLEQVWKNHPELTRLRMRKVIPLTSFEYCKNCDFVKFCGGNCPAVSISSIGIDEIPDESSCYRRFLENGGSLPDENFYT